CLTSFQPLAMTETTTQPRFIIRLPTGASLRGGSRGFYGSTMARADEAIFLWCYNCFGTCKDRVNLVDHGIPLAMKESNTNDALPLRYIFIKILPISIY